MAIRVSNSPVHILFAPLYWVFDNTKPKEEKPTLKNFAKGFERLCKKGHKPGAVEKRLLLSLLGGLGVIGGGVLWLYGYLKNSKLFKILGGILGISGAGSVITEIFKYRSLGISEITTLKKKKEPVQLSSSTALAIRNPNQPPPEDELPPELNDPTLLSQLGRIFTGSSRQVLKILYNKLKQHRVIWNNPAIELGMFVFTGPVTFLSYEALKAYYDLDEKGIKIEDLFNEETRKQYEKARNQYYDSRVKDSSPQEEYEKAINTFNSFIDEYNSTATDQLKKLTKNSTDEEIKKGYRALARKYHPDRNPGDDTTTGKFKEVTEAYEFIWECRKRMGLD